MGSGACYLARARGLWLLMKREEQADVAKATGAAITEVASVVEEMHKAIADPIFSVTAKTLGKAFGFDDKVDVDQLTAARSNFGLRANVYRAVRGTSALTSQGAAWVFGQLSEDPDAISIQDSKGGATTIAALTTAFGDNLRLANSSLAPEMTIRVDGKAVALAPEDLAAAFPGAQPKIVVSVHGLGATEHAWIDEDESFGKMLNTAYGFTPVFIRYNTGASIHQNGADFALLLQLLFDNWPVAVENIVLIGHSMGGLVIRSACAQVEQAIGGQDDDRQEQIAPWTDSVSQIFYVGSPHRGAPLEQVSNQAIGVIGLFKRSAPLVPLLNRRSAGIKDLRFGTLLAEELGEGAADPGSNHRDLADHLDIEPLANAEHHLIVGSKLSLSKGKVAELVGDIMVPVASASSRADGVNRADFADGKLYLIEEIAHIPMVNDPRVYEIIEQQIAKKDVT